MRDCATFNSHFIRSTIGPLQAADMPQQSSLKSTWSSLLTSNAKNKLPSKNLIIKCYNEICDKVELPLARLERYGRANQRLQTVEIQVSRRRRALQGPEAFLQFADVLFFQVRNAGQGLIESRCFQIGAQGNARVREQPIKNPSSVRETPQSRNRFTI